jgi:hypothetical protein
MSSLSNPTLSEKACLLFVVIIFVEEFKFIDLIIKYIIVASAFLQHKHEWNIFPAYKMLVAEIVEE